MQTSVQQPQSEQEIVNLIIKEMITAGRPLFQTDYRNELALRRWARDIPALAEKIYSDKNHMFCDMINSLIAIEYAGRYGRKMLERVWPIFALTRLDILTEQDYLGLKRDQKTVVDVLRDAKAKRLPLKEYVNSHGYHLRCWQHQDADFDTFMRANEDIAWEITALPKPESVTRFTRFINADVVAKYSSPAKQPPAKKPTLAMFPSQES